MPILLNKTLQSRIARVLLIIGLWGCALSFSLRDASSALRASYAILHNDAFWNPSKNAEESITLQRQIQAHYLSYGVYIPLDDIVIGAHEINSQALQKLIEGVCGFNSTAVWVPVALHFPIIGEKVFEWCLART